MKIHADDPFYIQLANTLRVQLKNGEFKAGQRFYSIRKLMQEFDRSLPTIRSAINILVEEGLLTARHGSGYYVTEKVNRKTTRENAKLLVCIPSYLTPYEPAFTGPIVTGMINEAEKSKGIVSFFQRTIPIPIRFDEAIARKDLDRILAENPDGIAWLHAFPTDSYILKELVRREIPVITTIRKLPGIDLPLIRENDHLQAMLTLSQFQSLGHKHVGIISRKDDDDEDYFPSKKRAFQEVGHSLGIPLPEKNFYYLNTPRELAAALNITQKKEAPLEVDPKLINIDKDVEGLQNFLEEQTHLTGLFILATSGIFIVSKLMEKDPRGKLGDMALLLNLLDGVKVPPMPNGEQLAKITPPREELGKFLVEKLLSHIRGDPLESAERLIPQYIPGDSMKPVSASASPINT